MRRAPIVIATTIAGTVGVLTFKPHEAAFPALASASASVASTTPTDSSSGSSGAGSSGSGSSGSGSTASSSSSDGSSTTATPAPTAASTAAKTATGDSIATQYGPVQVKVTVKDGKITTVTPLAMTGNDPKSAQISASAAPLLIQSTLSKQTAAVDAVSGATVTTAGYEASLQSALDKLGFKAADGSRGTSTVPQVEEHGGPGGFGH